MTLGQFLSRAAKTPFAWGTFDCLLWTADWVQLRHGIDLGAPWRGTYDSALACARILQREGGMIALMRRQAAEGGFAETGDPQPGDVGVIHVMTEDGPRLAGAIRTGMGWAALGVRGILVLQADAARAWSIR